MLQFSDFGTISLPVFIGGGFIGVVGIDLSLADMLAAASFLKEGSGVTSYTFVIDSIGQTLTHPLVSQPYEVTHEPVFVDIRDVEFDPKVEGVLNSMMR